MQIGEKIKTLRKELHISQAELAGEKITRNMLSQIENGFAMPSVDTLLYLSARLGVPAGFLLADASEDFIYRKSAEIAKIRESYRRGDWKGCKKLCELLGTQDSESDRYITGCMYHMAKDCFGYGELRRAEEGFLAVLERCEKGYGELYPDGFLNRLIAAESKVYLQCLSDISPVFSGRATSLPVTLFGNPEDPFILYYLFYKARSQRYADPSEIEAYLSSDTDSDIFYMEHIRARQYMQKKNYAEACALLREIAYGETPIPQPVFLFLLTDLEKCFRELGDFKGAYECAGLHRQLLESFLEESES